MADDPTPEDVLATETALGRPFLARFEVPIEQAEWQRILSEIAPGRRHDAVLVLRSAAGRYAVMRKPSYPALGWRLPGGGVHPGERMVDGAARELWEETGLRATPERYLLRAEVDFRTGDEHRRWTTHVLFAAAKAEEPFVVVDAGEAVAERAFVGPEQLRAAGDLFRKTGSAALRYRADLQDLILLRLGEGTPARPR